MKIRVHRRALHSCGGGASGNLRLQPGDIGSLTAILPTNKPVSVPAEIVQYELPKRETWDNHHNDAD